MLSYLKCLFFHRGIWQRTQTEIGGNSHWYCTTCHIAHEQQPIKIEGESYLENE